MLLLSPRLESFELLSCELLRLFLRVSLVFVELCEILLILCLRFPGFRLMFFWCGLEIVKSVWFPCLIRLLDVMLCHVFKRWF